MATLTDEERADKVAVKQQETEQNEKEETEQKQAKKSEHEDKYFVVHGGTCVCDKAEVPTTEAAIIVTKNKKLLINSDAKKFAATEEDTTMKPPTATFGKCTLKPSSSGNLPCAPAFLPKWEKAYDKKTVDGKKILTELSTLQCTIGGKISIKKHGQEDSVVKEHSENTDEAELALINSGVEIPKDEPKYPSVSSIIFKAIKENDSFKQISSKNSSAVEKVIIRLNEEATFTANIKEGNVSLTSWVIYDLKKGNLGEKIITNEQIGASFQNTFSNLGTFRIEGYGKPKMQEYENGIYNKNYPSCSIDVEVVQNKFEKLVIKDGEKFSRDKKGETKFRQDFPATFQAQFLFEPTEKEVRNLVIYATDASGNVISNGKQSGREFVFTPKNSTATYTIIATYTNDREEIVTKKLSGQTEATHVTTISHAAEVIRPETPMQFKVTGTQFGNTLTSAESAAIKWNLNGNYVGTGSCVDIPGVHFLKEGNYVVEAFVNSANATGKNAKNEDDDWHFKVSHNDVMSFVCTGQPKVGKKTQLKADKFLMPPIEGEKVVWNLFGLTLENSNYKNPILDITPTTEGKQDVICKIGHRKGIKQSINIVQAKIIDAFFVDDNGINITKAGWGQTVNIYLNSEHLTGEELNIQVYDQDYMSGNDPVYFKNIKKFDGKLINFKLDKSIKDKSGKWGRLYFKVTAPHLTLKNGDTRFPADKLNVEDGITFSNAIIGEENGSKKHILVDYDDVSWFYVNTTGIKAGTKLSVAIYKKDEDDEPIPILHLAQTIDEYGVLKAKIQWNKIPKIKKLRKVFIIIKDEKGKVLYNAISDVDKASTNLQFSPTAIKMMENKAAVVVGNQKISEIQPEKCPNCDKPVTVAELKQIFTTADDATLKKVAETYTKYMKELGMNTCWNKAHLFAQARVEAGIQLNLKDGEGFNYYYKSLSIFGAFQTLDGKEKAKLWGRPEINPKLPGVTKENQIKIANYAYSPPAKKAKEIGNTEANDGWTYRGRGLIQVTGKEFYEYCNKFTKDKGLDVVTNPNLISEKVELSVLSSMIFFKWKNINTLTKGNKDVIGSICPKVGNDAPMKDENGKPSSNHKEKQSIFDKYSSKVFKTNQCTLGTQKEKSDISLQTYDGSYKATDSEIYINVIVPTDRRNEGLLVFFDNEEVLFSCYVLAMGTTNNAIMIPEGKGSTPKGLWNSWYEAVHIGHKSYGDYGLIKVTGTKGDALTATKKGRAGIAIHAGHTIGNKGNVYNDKGALLFTYGCMRVYNADMKILVDLYKSKKKKNKKIHVYVEEVNDISQVFDYYGKVSDIKDTKREYSKNATQ